MKLLIYTIALFIFSAQLIAQLGNRFYGPTAFQEIQPSGDGNFYVIGTKDKAKAWLIKIDPNGNIIWERTYSGPSGQNVTANHLMVDSSGYILLVGAVNESFDQVGWAIKTDSLGNVLWNRKYGNGISIFCCCSNGSGGYFLGSFSAQGGSLINIKTDGTLNSPNGILYIKVVVGTKIKYIELNGDGTLTLIGRDEVIGAGFAGIFFTRIRKDGTRIATTTFETGNREYYDDSKYYSHPLGVLKKQNGNYIVTDAINHADCLLMEFDSNGRILSNKIYGDPTRYEYPYGIVELPDGDFLISGETKVPLENDFEYNPFLIRVSPTGYEKWRKYFNHGIHNARFFNGVSLSNGNLLFCGMAKDTLAYLLRMEDDGNFLNYTITGKVIYDTNLNCIADNGDYPISNVIVTNKNSFQSFICSDKSGEFSFKTNELINILIAMPPDENSKFCIEEQQVEIDTINNSASVQFLISPIDTCSKLRVNITQPDLVRCNESKYLVFVKNIGGQISDLQELIILCDSKLTIEDYSPGGKLNQNKLTYEIPPLQPNEEQVYQIEVKLECDVLLGASHFVTAELMPYYCSKAWNGPRLEIKSECRVDHVKFVIQNIGKSNMINDAYYRVFADQYLIDEEPIKLMINQSIELEYESKGKTFHVDIIDVNSVLPSDEYIYSTIEACGTNKNGIYSTGFSNAFHTYNADCSKSVSFSINSTGIPNRVQEEIEGLGFYHLITQNGWIEYTIRMRNPLDKEVNEAAIQLSFTSNLNTGSFQILSNSEYADLIPLDDHSLKIEFTNTKIGANNSGTSADLFFKFRIKSYDTTPANLYPQSFIRTNAKVYFEKEGPFSLLSSGNYITNEISYFEKSKEKYPDIISLFGGKYLDFGANIAVAKDGSVFLLIQSTSYNGNQSGSERFKYENVIIKMDKDSKVLWYTAITGKKDDAIYGEKIIALSDGGCMLLGSSVSVNKLGYVEENEVEISRVNNIGQTIFTKYYHPGLNLRGGKANDLLELKDGNFLVCGICSNGDNNEVDNYLMKIDENGNVIWLHDFILVGLAFEAFNVFELKNGDIICAGADDGRDLLVTQKLDSSGNQIWIKTITSQLVYDVYRPSAAVTKDDEVIFLMYEEEWDPIKNNYITSPRFMKVGRNGEFILEKKVLIGDYDYAHTNKLIQADDGSFFVLGQVLADTTTKIFDAMLAKFDQNLNLIWFKSYGSMNFEEFTDATIEDDKIIHMIGYNQDMPPDYNLQTIYLKTNLNGDLVKNENTEDENDDVLIYPNPTHDKVNVFFFNDSKIINTHWQLLDLNGRVMKKGIIQTNKLTIDLNEIIQGIYFLKFGDPSLPLQKIIVLH